jgi:hypothetical protein
MSTGPGRPCIAALRQPDFEAERIEWISLSAVPALIADGQIKAACTVAALFLLYYTRPG